MTEEDVLRLAAVAGLDIDPALLPEVARALAMLLEQARLLGPPLPVEVEPAPVFRP